MSRELVAGFRYLLYVVRYALQARCAQVELLGSCYHDINWLVNMTVSMEAPVTAPMIVPESPPPRVLPP